MLMILLTLAGKELAKQIGTAALKHGSNKVWVLLAGDAEAERFNAINQRLDQVLSELNKIRYSIAEVKTQIDDFHLDIKLDDVDRYANQIESLYDQYTAALDSLAEATKAEAAGNSSASAARKKATTRLTELGGRISNEVYACVKQINNSLWETGDRSLLKLAHNSTISRDFLSYFIAMKTLFLKYYLVQSKAIFIMSLAEEDPSVYFAEGTRTIQKIEEFMQLQENYLLKLIPDCIQKLVTAIALAPESTPINLRSSISGRSTQFSFFNNSHHGQPTVIFPRIQEWRLETMQPLTADHKEPFYFRLRNAIANQALVVAPSRYGTAAENLNSPQKGRWKIRYASQGRFWLEFMESHAGDRFFNHRLTTRNTGSTEEHDLRSSSTHNDLDKYQQFYIEPYQDCLRGVDNLISRERLIPETFIESNSKIYRLYYRSNGNFEVVKLPEEQIIWSANISTPEPGWLVIPNEGQLMACNARGEIYWSSDAPSQPAWIAQKTVLRLHDDGKLSLSLPDALPHWTN